MRRLFALTVRSLYLALPLAALLSAAPVRGAEVDKFLPNDSEVVVTVNIRQILDSPLAKKYGLEPLKEAIKSQDEIQKTLDSLGLDPLKDIDSFVTGTPSGGDPDKGLSIVHGRFDVAKFKAKAEDVAKDQKDVLKITKVGPHTVYEVNFPMAPKPMYFGIVDKTTIVVSPATDYVTDAFDKAAGTKKTELKKEIRDLVEKADAKQSLWVAILGSGLAKGPLAADEKIKGLLERMKTVAGGVTVADDVKADFVIGAKSNDDAKELATTIDQGVTQAKGLLGFIAAQKKELTPLISFLESIKVKTEGSNLSLTGQASKDVIEKALNK